MTLTHGHRQRIRKKFLTAENLKLFADYELLEALMFFAIPRQDVRNKSKEILSNLNNNFYSLVFGDITKLSTIPNINENLIFLIVIMREILTRVMNSNIQHKNLISNWQELLAYLKFSMGFLKTEQIRILFLNHKNYLITDEIHSHGDVSSSSISIREIIKKVLFYEASAVIIVHNHPTGISTPSQGDITATKQLLAALKPINVNLYDHIIITGNDYFSFRNNLII